MPKDRSNTLNTLLRLGTLVLAIGLSAAQGCGDSSGPPAVVAAIEIAAGDGQDGPANGPAPVPLRVTLRGAGGAPLAGGRVTWSVAAGSALLNPATSTSDANGRATTVVTLGPPGDVSVEASAGGLTPVTFHVHSRDRCAYLGPFRVDTAVTADLSGLDCAFGDGSYVDWYRFPSPAAQAVRVTMHAPFDAWLWLYTRAGVVVALDDNGGSGGTGPDASFKAIVPAGDFVVGANSLLPRAIGTYTLTATSTPLVVSGCEAVWLVGPLTFSETIESTDCSSPSYADLFLLLVRAGQTVTVNLSSFEVNPHVALYDFATGGLLASSEETSAPSEVNLSYTVPALGVYVLEASTWFPYQTGGYTLTVSAFASPLPSPSAPSPTAPIKGDRPGRSALPPQGGL